jgi:phenylalanyl-tRNA synthetase alpha chain
VVAELKQTLEGLALFLFGPETQVRWVDAFFPFTHPSFEMEVLFRGEWLEVLGCGVLQHAILDANVASPEQKGKVQAWAFGMGLERLAMVLFDIPDIRLFWSSDARFLGQFAPHADELLKIGKNGKKPHQFTNIKFSPFSKYPGCYKDVSFWLPKADAVPEPQGSSAGGEVKPHEGQSAAALAHAPASASSSSSSAFHENDLCSLVREVAGDLVENVTLLDSFVHPKTGAESRCYRILFRALDRNLTNEEIDVLQEKIRQQIPDRLGLKLR